MKEKVTICKQLWISWNVISLKYTLILDNSAAELQGTESYGLNCNQTETKFKQDQDVILFFFFNGVVYFRQIFLQFLWPALLWCIFSACQSWFFRVVILHDSTNIAVKLVCSLLM